LPGSSACRSAAGGQWSMRTSASMIGDKVKPRISDQVTCQVIHRAMPSACSSPCTMFTAERPPVRRSSTACAGNGLAVLFRPRRSPRSPTSRWSEGRCGAVATGRIVILAGTHRVPNSSVNDLGLADDRQTPKPQHFRDFRRLPTLANAPQKVLVMRRSRVRLPQAAPQAAPPPTAQMTGPRAIRSTPCAATYQDQWPHLAIRSAPRPHIAINDVPLQPAAAAGCCSFPSGWDAGPSSRSALTSLRFLSSITVAATRSPGATRRSSNASRIE